MKIGEDAESKLIIGFDHSEQGHIGYMQSEIVENYQ